MSSIYLNIRKMDTTLGTYRKPNMPSDIISKLAGKEVTAELKDGNVVKGELLSFDENSNIEIKVGDNTKFIQGESISILSFR